MVTTSGVSGSAWQNNFPAVSFSFSAWVEIEGVEYAAVQIAVTQSKVESRAVCELAVGVNTRDLSGRKAIPANFRFIRGAAAKVFVKVDSDVTSAGDVILLKAGTHLMFDGVIDDGGPSNLSHGRFNLRVIIVSKLIYLATGSLQFAGLPSGYLAGGAINVMNSQEYPIKIDADLAKKDFWAALQAAYIQTVEWKDVSGGNTNALQAFRDEFGVRRATANANLLREIKGVLPGGVFSDTSMVYAVTVYINAELHYDLGRQSVLQRIRALSEDFHFALVENGLGYAVVPYTPFVPQDVIAKTITPDTIYSIQWNNQSSDSIAGLVFIDNLEGSLFTPKTNSRTPNLDYIVLGSYKRPSSPMPTNDVDPNGDGLGMILPFPAPTWLSETGARPETRAQVPEVLGRIQTNADLRKFGDPYARELALKKSYVGRSLVVECPFRMDIGVCSPVKVVYPDVAGTGLADAAAIYGAVEGVSILLDAPSKRAVTVLEIMYARSAQQQIQDIDPGPIGPDSGVPAYLHPIWAKPYLGARLDEHPATGLTG